MTFEEKKEERRKENKKLKEYLRRGHEPEYHKNIAVFPLTNTRYFIPTNKKGDKLLGWRKIKDESIS